VEEEVRPVHAGHGGRGLPRDAGIVRRQDVHPGRHLMAQCQSKFRRLFQSQIVPEPQSQKVTILCRCMVPLGVQATEHASVWVLAPV
jgi:hypothetical protein